MPSDRELALAIATVGLIAWLYARLIAPQSVLHLFVSPDVFVALSLGQWIVSAFGGPGQDWVGLFVAFNRAIVAGLGLVYAWRATRYRLGIWRRRRALDVA